MADRFLTLSFPIYLRRGGVIFEAQTAFHAFAHKLMPLPGCKKIAITAPERAEIENAGNHLSWILWPI